jgi:hypothetical protein
VDHRGVPLARAVLILFGLVAGAVLLVVGLARMRRRRGVAVSWAAAGVVVLTLVGAWATAPLRARNTDVWANGLAGPLPGFHAPVVHQRVYATGSSYAFRVDEPRDELFAELSAAYPDGRVAGDTWSTVVSGLGYTVAPAADLGKNAYVLEADTICISTAIAVFIPFPPAATEELGGTLRPWTPTPVSLDRAAFAAYYASLGTVRVDGDAFEVPTSDDRTARVVVAAGTVAVSFES